MAAFQDKTAIITGASSGIGGELARQLAAAGARVGLIARRGDRLEALARELRSAGRQVAYVVADVVDKAAVGAAVQSLERELGASDLLFANAGVALKVSARRLDPDKVRETFEVNVFGAVNAIAAVLPGMLQRRSGHIIGMSSLAAFRAPAGSSAYCASKSALSALLESYRLELYGSGIAVTTICPGFIRSEITAVNKFKMPLLLDTEPAVQRMLRAVARRQALCIFPRRLYWAIRLSRLLPEALMARVAMPK